MHTILLVDDDPDITMLLKLHLDSDLYHLTFSTNGKDALEKIYRENYNLIILDINLPDTNGFEICKKVRKDNLQIPIIMLTSLARESDKVLAFQLGADDYVTKPFGIMEFWARIKSLLRRSGLPHYDGDGKNMEIVYKELHIDRNRKRVTLKGERLNLTSKEFDLLLLLATNPGRTFARRDLLEIVWGSAFKGYEHTVTAHINRLRNKLEEDIDTPQYIITTWGSGYRFID